MGQYTVLWEVQVGRGYVLPHEDIESGRAADWVRGGPEISPRANWLFARACRLPPSIGVTLAELLQVQMNDTDERLVTQMQSILRNGRASCRSFQNRACSVLKRCGSEYVRRH